MPALVRTIDDTDLERLREAGAAEVVPEAIEGSLMLGAQALALVGRHADAAQADRTTKAASATGESCPRMGGMATLPVRDGPPP